MPASEGLMGHERRKYVVSPGECPLRSPLRISTPTRFDMQHNCFVGSYAGISSFQHIPESYATL